MAKKTKKLNKSKKVSSTSNRRRNINSSRSGLSFSKKKLFIFAIIFGAIGGYFIYYSFAATVNFTKVATHPQAADGTVQTTELARTISALESWNGKLYSGYGDWGFPPTYPNTGPISINSLDVTTSTFASNTPTKQLLPCSNTTGSPEVCFHAAESIHSWRKINGNLYAPSAQSKGGRDYITDPINGVPYPPADYAVGTIDSNGTPVWKNVKTGDCDLCGFWHPFDVVTLTGSDLWVVGQINKDAVARRSMDGGATWTEEDKHVVVNTGNSSALRFYGAAVYKGKLYLQAINNDGGWTNAEPVSQVFDPTTNVWTKNGPNLGVFSRAEEFDGKMVYIASAASSYAPRLLKIYNGAGEPYSSGLTVFNYTIDRATNTLYALTSTGEVKKTTNLTDWTLAATAPTVARSIAVLNGTVYVGGTDSAIYKHDGTGGIAPDTTIPIVTITQPADGAKIGNRLTVQATSSDNIGVKKMEILIDGVIKTTSATASIKYGGKVATGSHTITVKAYDESGNIGQSSVTIIK